MATMGHVVVWLSAHLIAFCPSPNLGELAWSAVARARRVLCASAEFVLEGNCVSGSRPTLRLPRARTRAHRTARRAMGRARGGDPLDADIADDAIPNTFRAFFHAHPDIQLIGFNGGTAAKLYERHVLTTLSDEQRAIPRSILPSTSPAHAGLSFAEKVKRWSAIFGDLA
jgi:hypothetical protein